MGPWLCLSTFPPHCLSCVGYQREQRERIQRVRLRSRLPLDCVSGNLCTESALSFSWPLPVFISPTYERIGRALRYPLTNCSNFCVLETRRNGRNLFWLVPNFTVPVIYSPWSSWYGTVVFISFVMDCFLLSFWICMLKGRSPYVNMHLLCQVSQQPRCLNIDFEDNVLHNLYVSKQKEPILPAGKHH